MIGTTRGISTLAGAAVAGILIWFATQVGAEASGDYWATYALIAAAGLTMALSQILGGWTKWGWPRFSVGVFALGFLPALVAGGWVLLARQPADWMNTSNWSRDLGFDGIVGDLGNILPAIAFGIGLIFGFSFDTAGPRREIVEDTRIHDDRLRDADAPLTADRHAVDRDTVDRTAVDRDTVHRDTVHRDTVHRDTGAETETDVRTHDDVDGDGHVDRDRPVVTSTREHKED